MTEPAAPGTGTTTPPPADDDQKPEVDWKARAREWEKRAKANADAADRLAKLEEDQKTEAQKLADAKAAAEKDAADARVEALRWRIAAKHGISDEDAELFLLGSDEDTLTKQAERLAGRAAETKRNGNVVPKEGATTPPPKGDELREFSKRLFTPEA